jgi:uncharacterized protein YbjT (DUF2867 family)
MRTALIAGATGLIGKQLLEALLKDPTYSHIKAVTRKPLGINHQRLENILVDFDKLEEHKDQLTADDVFCCLGTTMKKAGSKEAFRKVDYEYPLALAKILKADNAEQYLLVSALGATKDSSIFYNQVKGEIEEDIEKVGFDSYHIFRPSLLLGPREEQRAGEDAAKVVYKVFGFLIPQKYKGIEAVKVAQAMLHFAKQKQKGKHIHESVELQKY